MIILTVVALAVAAALVLLRGEHEIYLTELWDEPPNLHGFYLTTFDESPDNLMDYPATLHWSDGRTSEPLMRDVASSSACGLVKHGIVFRRLEGAEPVRMEWGPHKYECRQVSRDQWFKRLDELKSQCPELFD